MHNSFTNLHLLTADLSTAVHSRFCDKIPFIEVRTLFSETVAVKSRNVNMTLQPVIYGINIYQHESMKAWGVDSTGLGFGQVVSCVKIIKNLRFP
jgi:hypothetical protein